MTNPAVDSKITGERLLSLDFFRGFTMFLLIADSATDDKKIHIRIATGWLKTAALT